MVYTLQVFFMHIYFSTLKALLGGLQSTNHTCQTGSSAIDVPFCLLTTINNSDLQLQTAGIGKVFKFTAFSDRVLSEVLVLWIHSSFHLKYGIASP